MFWLIDLVAFASAYFIGAIPSGYLIGLLAGIGDIRKHGSGNIGATNIARVLGWKYSLAVFLIDCFKAYGYLWLLHWLHFSSTHLMIAAMLILLGNGISIFLKGSGGKGVATSIGIILFFFPAVLVPLCVVWVLLFYLTKTVGIANVAVSLLFPLMIFALHYPSEYVLFASCMTLWITIKHIPNLRQFFSPQS